MLVAEKKDEIVEDWISYFIPYITGDEITYPCWDYS